MVNMGSLSPLKSALIFLADYEWETSPSYPFFEDNRERVFSFLDKVMNGYLARHAKSYHVPLAKLGFYLLHRRRTEQAQGGEDIAWGGRILGRVYHDMQKDFHTKGERKRDGFYYKVVNNLAYAFTLTGKHREAQNLVEETLRGTSDVSLKSFAQRIKGQIFFGLADHTDDFERRYDLVKRGIKACYAGTRELDEDKPKDLTEIARTYNRNAVELLKLFEYASTAGEMRIVLSHAWHNAKEAESYWLLTDVLWDEPARSAVFGFRERTAETKKLIVDNDQWYGFGITAAEPTHPTASKSKKDATTKNKLG